MKALLCSLTLPHITWASQVGGSKDILNELLTVVKDNAFLGAKMIWLNPICNEQTEWKIETETC